MSLKSVLARIARWQAAEEKAARKIGRAKTARQTEKGFSELEHAQQMLRRAEREREGFERQRQGKAPKAVAPRPLGRYEYVWRGDYRTRKGHHLLLEIRLRAPRGVRADENTLRRFVEQPDTMPQGWELLTIDYGRRPARMSRLPLNQRQAFSDVWGYMEWEPAHGVLGEDGPYFD